MTAMCVECSKPARLARGLDDIYSETCSNECSVALWNREQRAGRIVCVGELTTKDIDERLSTTGLDVEALVGEGAST